MHAVLRRMANTLWVYVPTKENFFSLKTSDHEPAPPQPPDAVMTIHFLDAQYQDKTFKVRYDISKAKKSAADYGYSFQYEQSFSEHRRQVLTAVGRAFSDVEYNETTGKMQERIDGDVDYGDTQKQTTHKKLVQAYVKTDVVPDFFVIVIADIKNGLESKMIFYFKDLNRGLTDPTFGEEYTRRIVSEETIGYTAIKGDVAGRHVRFDNITWPKFLSKLIAHRVRFKFVQSSIPPSEKINEEVLKIVATTLNIYPYEGFRSVELHNLDTEENFSFLKEELKTYAEK